VQPFGRARPRSGSRAPKKKVAPPEVASEPGNRGLRLGELGFKFEMFGVRFPLGRFNKQLRMTAVVRDGLPTNFRAFGRRFQTP
jgi:hypothetical protein